MLRSSLSELLTVHAASTNFQSLGHAVSRSGPSLIMSVSGRRCKHGVGCKTNKCLRQQTMSDDSGMSRMHQEMPRLSLGNVYLYPLAESPSLYPLDLGHSAISRPFLPSLPLSLSLSTRPPFIDAHSSPVSFLRRIFFFFSCTMLSSYPCSSKLCHPSCAEAS